jgi:hypothetical protein
MRSQTSFLTTKVQHISGQTLESWISSWLDYRRRGLKPESYRCISKFVWTVVNKNWAFSSAVKRLNSMLTSKNLFPQAF